jgi:hypothetical protein
MNLREMMHAEKIGGIVGGYFPEGHERSRQQKNQ